MPKRSIVLAAVTAQFAGAIALFGPTALAWDATFPTGPLKGPEVISSDSKHALSFEIQTVAYPHEDGATPGQGWDYLLGTKTSRICIENYTADVDKSQAVPRHFISHV